MIRVTAIRHPITIKEAVKIMKENGYFRRERLRQLRYIKYKMTEYKTLHNST